MSSLVSTGECFVVFAHRPVAHVREQHESRRSHLHRGVLVQQFAVQQSIEQGLTEVDAGEYVSAGAVELRHIGLPLSGPAGEVNTVVVDIVAQRQFRLAAGLGLAVSPELSTRSQ